MVLASDGLVNLDVLLEVDETIAPVPRGERLRISVVSVLIQALLEIAGDTDVEDTMETGQNVKTQAAEVTSAASSIYKS